MKREIPLLIVGITGFAMLIQYFIPTDLSQNFFTFANDWVIVIGIISMPLGIWSLVKANILKLRVPGERFYSAVLLFGFLIMVLTCLKDENRTMGSFHMDLFSYVLVPIQATIFSLLAFFIASAAYRAFRARSLLATFLLLTAFIIMFRFIPLGPISTVNLTIVSWILQVPNMAANRAIMMGIGLGATATAMKIILGIERTYMGHD
jgi:hypothetical protein